MEDTPPILMCQKAARGIPSSSREQTHWRYVMKEKEHCEGGGGNSSNSKLAISGGCNTSCSPKQSMECPNISKQVCQQAKHPAFTKEAQDKKNKESDEDADNSTKREKPISLEHHARRTHSPTHILYGLLPLTWQLTSAVTGQAGTLQFFQMQKLFPFFNPAWKKAVTSLCDAA